MQERADSAEGRAQKPQTQMRMFPINASWREGEKILLANGEGESGGAKNEDVPLLAFCVQADGPKLSMET